MKKEYVKPVIEIERFQVNEAIASGCTKTVNLGPSTATYTTTCSDYLKYEDEGERSNLVTASESFWKDVEGYDCGCTYTSGTGTLMSS